jgi:hypothetical protein
MDMQAVFSRENDRILDYIVRSCQDLTDEQVCYSNELVDERWIGNLTTHMYGIVVQRFEMIAGLDTTPAAEAPETTAALLAQAHKSHDRIGECLPKMTEADLAKTHDLRGNQVAAQELIMNSFSHAFRHVGNILDARHLGGFETHALG